MLTNVPRISRCVVNASSVHSMHFCSKSVHDLTSYSNPEKFNERITIDRPTLLVTIVFRTTPNLYKDVPLTR